MNASKAILKDFRTYVVAVVVGLGIAGWRALLHDHVRVRAWTVVAAVAVILLIMILLDWLRARERDRATAAQGALDQAEKRAESAQAVAKEPEPNAAAKEVLRMIEALRKTVEQRVQGFANTRGIEANESEFGRFSYVLERVEALIQPMPLDLNNLLVPMARATETTPLSVESILSGLDHMEAEVTNWGLVNERNAPAPQAGGEQVITGPDMTLVINPNRPKPPA